MVAEGTWKEEGQGNEIRMKMIVVWMRSLNMRHSCLQTPRCGTDAIETRRWWRFICLSDDPFLSFVMPHIIKPSTLTPSLRTMKGGEDNCKWWVYNKIIFSNLLLRPIIKHAKITAKIKSKQQRKSKNKKDTIVFCWFF